MTPLITADEAAFQSLFPLKPFRINHGLAGDPRLTLPAILELVKALPRDRIEYNSGKAAVSQDPTTTPLVDLSPEDVIRNVETAGAWMVLKRVEHHPTYRKLLEEVLESVAKARGFRGVADARFTDIQGFLFVSSPNSTTPFHLDSEDNFFVQIHGDKQFAIYDNTDRAIASEEQVEHAITKHRNLKFDDSFATRGTVNELKPGEGVFVPYIWPHWVKTKDSYSISLAITWKTPEVKKRNDLYVANGMLRDRGFPQGAPGSKPAWDAIKIAAFRSLAAAVAPLRQSEGFRKMIRTIVLGKNANYYYRDKAKPKQQVGM
jgi:hypothetical protein